jgi:hypothetical protein
MSNEIVTFEGLCRWASIPPNEARKPFEIDTNEPDNCAYSIEVECPKAQFDALMAKGLPRLTALKTDAETGKTYIRVKATKKKGKWEFPDPAVVDMNGQKVVDKVANGSSVIVKAELAPIKGRSGVAMRMLGVQITNLIPFGNSGAALFDFEEKQSSEQDQNNTIASEPEDDIPF